MLAPVSRGIRGTDLAVAPPAVARTECSLSWEQYQRLETDVAATSFFMTPNVYAERATLWRVQLYF